MILKGQSSFPVFGQVTYKTDQEIKLSQSSSPNWALGPWGGPGMWKERADKAEVALEKRIELLITTQDYLRSSHLNSMSRNRCYLTAYGVVRQHMTN